MNIVSLLNSMFNNLIMAESACAFLIVSLHNLYYTYFLHVHLHCSLCLCIHLVDPTIICCLFHLCIATGIEDKKGNEEIHTYS